MGLSVKTVLSVNKSRCPQNHSCPAIRVCPVDALRQNRYEAPQVDQAKCIACGKCVKFCPMNALQLQETPELQERGDK